MNLLARTLHQEMDSAEAHAMPVSRARQLLEIALSNQLRSLADGLLAAIILKQGNVGDVTWKQHAQTSNWPAQREIANTDGNFTGVDEFCKAIMKGAIRPVQINEFPTIKLRIVRNTVPLWNDLEVNRQLRKLGSNLRLASPGSHQLTASAIRAFAGKDNDSWPIDARFIFGEVGPCTSTFFGPLFEFRREIAVSPYVETDAGGFQYDNVVVVRDAVIRQFDYESTSDTDAEFLGRRLHILIHEMIHVISHKIAGEDRFAYAEVFWEQSIEDDLCRFTQVPKLREQCEQEFDRYLRLYLRVLDDARRHLEKPWDLPKTDVGETIDRLIRGGRLKQMADGQLSSIHTEGAAAWSL